jgi:hypothetical protein
MKLNLLIISLILIIVSCKKDNDDPIDTGLISGTFHVSGKIYNDCGNNPPFPVWIKIGHYTNSFFYQILDSVQTDSTGNYYLEYSVTNASNPSNSLSIGSYEHIPYCKNIDQMNFYLHPQTIFSLSVNFINPPPSDTLQLSIPVPPWSVNLYAPFQSGHVMTFTCQPTVYSYSYNTSVRIGYGYFHNGNHEIYFPVTLCDTTEAVLEL